MVEVNEDASVVTAKIRRETQAAQVAKAEESPVVATSIVPAFVIPKAQAVVPANRVPRTQTDSAAAFRQGRLAVMVVLALVLLLVWIRQRRLK